jgi:cytidine deaminase
MTPGTSPFAVDPVVATRRRELVADLGPGFPAHLAAALEAAGPDPVHPVAIVPAAAVRLLVATLHLEDPEEVMLLALETARGLARPPVSGYRVGAVGLTAGSGDLVLGGNLEVPGATAWSTVHGEGSVTLLARARGEAVATLAISQARPCAHCRQVLAEMDEAHGHGGGSGLRLIDPLGHVLRLADLYPWPFLPADLGRPGARPGEEAWPDLALSDDGFPSRIATALLRAGRRAHAPYSGAPAAVALALRDGLIVTGSVLESVAFNPTIGPLQDAFVGLLAAGRELDEIESAWLAVGRDAGFGHVAATGEALAATAAAVPLRVTSWA